MGQDNCKLQPGDLIEIDQRFHQHWALYMGDGYVVTLTPGGENSPPQLAGSVTIATKKAKAKKELLKEVAGNDEWRVNNKYDLYRTPFPMEEIIRRAEQWVGKDVTYLLLHKNCEHFVTELRYGKGVSAQV
ncbi:HRSL1 enzyme, partial [Bombycilla garrulus]|nr:HRSL1 enzyme [Bombycilla garrulus]